MNKRQTDILLLLLAGSDQYVLVQNIAEQMDCSEKTIRSDLKVIESYLQEQSSGTIIRKPGLGVYLDIDESERASLFRLLQEAKAPAAYEENEERLLQIAYALLMNMKQVTAQDLTRTFYVSKSVIKKDLDSIASWLERYGLQLVTKQKVGLMIEGAEKDKRMALSRLSELISSKEVTDAFIKNQFSAHEVAVIEKKLTDFQKRHSLFFTDESFEGLLLHTLLLIKRTKLNQPISISENELSHLKDKKEYEWTEELLKGLEPFFAVHFPIEEIAYLALHILAGKFRYGQNNGFLEEHDFNGKNPLLPKVLNYMVSRMSELYMFDFSKDEILINGLKVHLYSTLNRLESRLSFSNPMLNDIKKMYPYMFDTVIYSLEQVNNAFSLDIPEEEGAYLTLHFQASVERINDQEKSINAVIVCHMGIGMSQLLRTKIERKFHSIDVAGCIAASELKQFLTKNNVDLVISTIALPDLETPNIVVSPLLDASEETRLQQYVRRLVDPDKTKIKESVVLKYTNPFLVLLQQEIAHPYELIEKLSNLLFSKGFVEKEYAHSSIERERLSSTAIGSAIAIPHGNPGLIKQSAIAIATLKEPIEWGQEMVSLVFLLAVKNEAGEETKELFSEISYLSEHPAQTGVLIKETDILKFLSYFNK